MSTAPAPYERVTSFYSYEATYPARPKRGADLDAEFNAVRSTLNSAVERLAEIQRDDGLLANASVHPQALTSDTFALLGSDFVPRGSWMAVTTYNPGDLVEHNGLNYLATVTHVSANFDIDLASGYWQAFGGYPNAGQVVFMPSGSIAASSVQDAIMELDGDLQGRQPGNSNLSALSGLSGAANKLPYFTGPGAMALADMTAAGRTFLSSANVSAQQQALGLVPGIAAGNVVVLGDLARLPPVDGSQLVNIVVPNASITEAKLASTLNLSGKTLTLPAANTPALTKSYESPQQGITAGGALTLSHGLGVVPKLITAELVCLISELNWVANDRVSIACGTGADPASNRGMSVYFDAAGVYVRFGSAPDLFVVNDKASGATAAITPANWKLVIRAWA